MSVVAGLAPQGRVLHALILRETRTRFGNNQLGYLWAFIEPVFVIIVFVGLFTVAKRVPPAGMDLIGFIVTGFLPFLLFMHSVQKGASAISTNKPLLFYPRVRPLDLVLSRGVLELGTFVAVFAVLMGLNALVDGYLHIDSVLWVLFGFVLAAMLGSSFGLVVCTLSVLHPVTQRLYKPILRPLFWLSGIFFTASSLPSAARELLLWNPLLHIAEIIRAGWYSSYDDRFVNLPFLLGCIAALTLAGLALERVVRRKLEVA